MHSQNTVYCNFFAAKPKFWKRWLQIGELLFELSENQHEDLGRKIAAGTMHNGHMQYPLKVFMQERIASLLLAAEDWQVSTYDVFKMPNLLPIFLPFKSELIACDSLKIAYAQTGKETFQKEYKKNKKLHCKCMRWKIANFRISPENSGKINIIAHCWQHLC